MEPYDRRNRRVLGDAVRNDRASGGRRGRDADAHHTCTTHPTAASVAVQPTAAQHGPMTRNELLRLQGVAGNDAVARLVEGATTVQRDPTPVNAGTPGNDEGGPADVTTLETDLRQILQQWQDGAKDGVSQFVTNTLSSRLDDLESGNWNSLLAGLLGNTAWAATTFREAGAVTFAISMVGILIAAYPTAPKKSKSAIPEIQTASVDYINAIYKQANTQLRGRAANLLAQHPQVTRYRALAAIVRNSFASDTFTIDTSYSVIPTLEKGAIRDRFVNMATERLDILTTVGHSVRDRDAPVYTEKTTEVAWIKGPVGRSRLAVIITTTKGDEWSPSEARGKNATHELKNWVSPQNAQVAAETWIREKNERPATYDASKIDGLSG